MGSLERTRDLGVVGEKEFQQNIVVMTRHPRHETPLVVVRKERKLASQLAGD